MNEMKAKALEKLMMILDEVLGEDVVGRMKSKVEEKTGESEEEEESEEEGKDKEVASGGASVLALPQAESEEMPSSKHEGPKKPEGIGIEVQDVKVAAMPRPGLMKKMGKKLA